MEIYQPSKEFFMNKVTVKFYMLGAFMKDGVFGNVYGCLAITLDRYRDNVSDAEFMEKTPEPS